MIAVYWPAALLLLLSLGVLVAPVLKHAGLTLLCVSILLGVSIYYFTTQKNTLQHFSATHRIDINQALNHFPAHQHPSGLLCRAMLNTFSTHTQPDTALIHAANCFDQTGMHAVAHDITQYVLNHHPNHPPALYLKTKTHLTRYGIDSIEFTQALHELLSQAPSHPDGLWLLAAHQYYKGDYAKALTTLNTIEPLISRHRDIDKQKLSKLKQFKNTVERAAAEYAH